MLVDLLSSQSNCLVNFAEGREESILLILEYLGDTFYSLSHQGCAKNLHSAFKVATPLGRGVRRSGERWGGGEDALFAVSFALSSAILLPSMPLLSCYLLQM